VNEKQFGEALLNLDVGTGPAGDPKVLTERVLARDRRRVRALTWLAAGSWVVAAGLVLLLLVVLALLFPAMAKVHDEAFQGRLTPAQREAAQVKLDVGFRMTSVGITVAVGALALAALCTLGLVAATRRATLRQVNANLVEVTEQLKQLRQALAGRPGP